MYNSDSSSLLLLLSVDILITQTLFSVMLGTLLYRLPQLRVIRTWNRWRECEYHLWCSSKAYKELLDASCYADCPGCGKDVSLIGDEDDIP